MYSLAKTWKPKHIIDFHDSRWIIFMFDPVLDIEDVIYFGPYFVYRRSLILKKIPLFFSFGKEEMTNVPIWVNFLDLPVDLYKKSALSEG